MRTGTRRLILAAFIVTVIGLPGQAAADETDNFTCRGRLRTDSLAILDDLMNSHIRAAVARANRQAAPGCDASCLFKTLRKEIGGSDLHPLTFVPHARFEGWIDARKDVERCRVRFSESIYGARPYNQPWLFPFTGRVILIADSILLSGRTVGLDKINHFLREGLEHWRDAARPGHDIATVMAKELGEPGRQLRWNEYGLKGWSLTGVLAYADLAASYSGFRFWSDLLSLGGDRSYLAWDDESGRYVQRRLFTFAEYVNDAWDEGINYSVFQPGLAREVATVLERRSMSRPLSACMDLARLPDAALYVNPACAAASTPSQREIRDVRTSRASADDGGAADEALGRRLDPRSREHGELDGLDVGDRVHQDRAVGFDQQVRLLEHLVEHDAPRGLVGRLCRKVERDLGPVHEVNRQSPVAFHVKLPWNAVCGMVPRRFSSRGRVAAPRQPLDSA